MTNGDIWYQPEFPNNRRMVLWITGDSWVLVGIDVTPPLVCSTNEAHVLWISETLRTYLVDHGYHHVCEQVGRVVAKRKQDCLEFAGYFLEHPEELTCETGNTE